SSLDCFRGIVNTSIIIKILTAVLTERLDAALRHCGFLSGRQHGFRRGCQVVVEAQRAAALKPVQQPVQPEG
ncbi:unnamed protein product, partial [Amoebophrya sp. A120]